MTRVLLTAFEPYDRWRDNASWLALVDLVHWYDGAIEMVTRRYPVELTRVEEQLKRDLQGDFDFALHLGQSPGHPLIKLEQFALNLRGDGSALVTDGPAAYRTDLPLETFRDATLAAKIPCELSRHAGNFLCNAIFYLSQHYAATFGLKTRSLFIHVPLCPAQVAEDATTRMPSMSTPMTAAAIAAVLQALE